MMTFTPPRRLSRLGVVAALALAFGAVSATPALAHTRLVSSTPGKDATAASVSQVTLTFSDRISVAEVVVSDGAGEAFQSGRARRDGATVTQKVEGPLPAGQYTVAYAVVGADGHRIEKADLGFTAEGAGSAGIVSAQPVSPRPTLTLNQRTGPAASVAKDTEKEPAGVPSWIMILAGALIGIGIGMVIVFRAKRTHPVPAPRSGKPSGDKPSGDEPSGDEPSGDEAKDDDGTGGGERGSGE